MNPKFKNLSTNTWATRSLFVEITRTSATSGTYEHLDEDECPYWLVHNFEDDRPALRELFLDLADPTGMDLAEKYLGGWRHLQQLLKCKWFKTEWDKWQEELFMKIQSENLKKIKEIAAGEGASALAAAKYLANKEWEKTEPTRGRPTTAEVKGALKQEVKAKTDIRNDYERMVGHLTVVNGGRADKHS